MSESDRAPAFAFQRADDQLREDLANMRFDLRDAISKPEEIYLRSLRRLYMAWGYRTGPSGEMQAFELALHDGNFYHYLTDYSDPVFRNLEQIDALEPGLPLGPIILACDSRDKLALAALSSGGGSGEPEEMRAAAEHLRRFLAQPRAADMLKNLASSRVTGHSIGFAAVVCAANAMLAIASGEFDAAREIARAYVSAADRAYEEDDLW